MKKVFGIVALALAMAACNKNEMDAPVVEQPATKSERINITATLAPKIGGTKAVTDNEDGKITVNWAVDEHIAILYQVSETNYAADAVVTAVSGDGSATISFSVESGTADNTPCTLVYPSSAAMDDHSGVKDATTLLIAQDGTLNANLDVRVGAGTIQTATPGLTVTTQPEAQFAIFKFTIKNSTGSETMDVTSLAITAGAQRYFITLGSKASTLYAALPAADHQNFSFSAVCFADNETYTFTKDDISFVKGKYYPSTLKMTKKNQEPLSGVFSVAADKTVKFSKGNLVATITAVDGSGNPSYATGVFHDNQSDCVYPSGGTQSFDIGSEIDLFGWVGNSSTTLTNNAARYGISSSTTEADYGNVKDESLKSDWGNIPGIGKGWCTLSYTELQYLFTTRIVNGGTGEGYTYTDKVQLNGLYGLVIYPDGYSGSLYTTGSDWGTFESAGCVFLPGAGSRIGNNLGSTTWQVHLWSSTAYYSNTAYHIIVYDDGVVTFNLDAGFRYSGHSVRLVHDLN